MSLQNLTRKIARAAALAVALTLGAAPAAADGPEDFEAAKQRFERGVELFNQKLFGPALAELTEARRLYPSWKATLYAARSLRELGRFDDSLDVYAVLVRDFGQKLKDDKRDAEMWKAVLAQIDDLRKLVGTLEIEGAEPSATILIDGRERGLYPLLEPLRVPSGTHIVRVFKQGYEPFQTLIDVPGGTRRVVAAKLPKLLATGTLQVTEARGRELDVIVDGFPAGKTPLNMPVKPGKHSVLLRGEGKLGTAPARVMVKADELSTVRIEAEVLNATLRIAPTPFDAMVSVDGVEVGAGAWDGQVRAGGHTIEVAAEGFLSHKRKILLLNDKRQDLPIELERDPKSPFWRKPPPPPHFVVELATGLLIAPSFGGEIAGTCAKPCSGGAGVGGYNVLHGGYELSSGLGFGVSVGTMTATQKTKGRPTVLNIVGHPAATMGAPAAMGDSTDNGTTDDVLKLRGLVLGAWVGYSIDVGLPLHFRLGAGGVFGSVLDARRGSFTASRDGAAFEIGTYTETHTARFVFVTPEVRVGLPLGKHVELNAGLLLPFLFSVSRPMWSDTHAVNAASDGYGWFGAQQLLGSVLVTVAPTVGARFDL